MSQMRHPVYLGGFCLFPFPSPKNVFCQVDNSIANATRVSSVALKWVRSGYELVTGGHWAVCILSERRDGRGWLLELVLVAGSPPAAGAGDHATYSRHPPLATARTWVSKVS